MKSIMLGKGGAAPDQKTSPSITMTNLARLSILIGEAEAERGRDTASQLGSLGVGHVEQVETVEALLLALKKQAFDVVLCSERLEGEDGLAVLRAAQDVAPATRRVLMRRADGAGGPAPAGVEVIEQPASPASLKSLLHRAVSPQGGFWCQVPELSLADILQMYHQARRSVTVLMSGPVAGRIQMEAGELVDAEADGARGTPALSRLLEADSGLIRTEASNPDVQRTISAPFQSVVLEAAHRLDERRRDSKVGLIAESGPASSGAASSGPASSGATVSRAPIGTTANEVTVSAPVSAAPIPPALSGVSFPPIVLPGSAHPPGSATGSHSGEDSFGDHELIRLETPTFSGEMPRPSRPSMLPVVEPNPESFFAPDPGVRRQKIAAAVSVFASLLFAIAALLYFKDRLDISPTAPLGDISNDRDSRGPDGSGERGSGERGSGEREQATPALSTARDALSPAPADTPNTPAPAELAEDPLAAAEKATNPEAPSEPSGAAVQPGPESFELRITSKPSRATVIEDGRILGKTPLLLTIASSSVATAPREFVVHLPGHVPARIVRGPSPSNVSAALVLQPRPAPPDSPDAGVFDDELEQERPGSPRARRKDLGIRLRR